MLYVTVTGVVADQGTIVLLEGLDLSEDGHRRVVFAADHHPGRAILNALEGGLDPVAEVPDYMVLIAEEAR